MKRVCLCCRKEYGEVPGKGETHGYCESCLLAVLVAKNLASKAEKSAWLKMNAKGPLERVGCFCGHVVIRPRGSSGVCARGHSVPRLEVVP